MSKRTGCLIILGGAVLAFVLSLRPWEPLPARVVQDVLQGLRTGRPCAALGAAVDHSRIECFEPKGYMARIMSRKTGLWITPREIQQADTLIGLRFEILRSDGERYWVHQPKLDITFAVDDRLLVNFAQGKTTLDSLFQPVPASPQPTPLTQPSETDNLRSPPSSQHTAMPTPEPR